MRALQAHAFGKLRLQYGEQKIASFPTRHVEELMGYFLLNPNMRHGREKLIGILWPRSNLDKARGRFSTVLWRLRSLFDDLGTAVNTCLPATRDWVAFSPDFPVQLDAELFQHKLSQVDKIEGQGREHTLQSALDLYTGHLFEGIYSDWCLTERERLARLRLKAMGQFMVYCMRRKGFTEAVDWGQAILQEDPLREEVHRAIMQCYHQMGLYPQAIKQFQYCADLLHEELGVLPLPETIITYREIVTKRLTAVSPSLQPSLRQAFTNFQKATNRLNQLLDELE